MPDRRLSQTSVLPAYEDAGLFKNKLGRIDVELVPVMHRNSRKDLIVVGFMDKTIKIDVLFAGRRVREVAPLEAILRRMRDRLNMPTENIEALEKLRCPISIEGSWRPVFKRDDTGWETRSFQLIAARWIVPGKDGKGMVFGKRPVHPGKHSPAKTFSGNGNSTDGNARSTWRC